VFEGHFQLQESLVAIGEHVFSFTRVDANNAEQEMARGAQREFDLKICSQKINALKVTFGWMISATASCTFVS